METETVLEEEWRKLTFAKYQEWECQNKAYNILYIFDGPHIPEGKEGLVPNHLISSPENYFSDFLFYSCKYEIEGDENQYFGYFRNVELYEYKLENGNKCFLKPSHLLVEFEK